MATLLLESITQSLMQGPISTRLHLCQNPQIWGSASVHVDFVQIVTSCFAIWNLAQGVYLYNFIATGWALYISCYNSVSNLYEHFAPHNMQSNQWGQSTHPSRGCLRKFDGRTWIKVPATQMPISACKTENYISDWEVS